MLKRIWESRTDNPILAMKIFYVTPRPVLPSRKRLGWKWPVIITLEFSIFSIFFFVKFLSILYAHNLRTSTHSCEECLLGRRIVEACRYSLTYTQLPIQIMYSQEFKWYNVSLSFSNHLQIQEINEIVFFFKGEKWIKWVKDWQTDIVTGISNDLLSKPYHQY